MKMRYKVSLAAAGLLAISTAALAGLWPGFPIVGIGTVCWGTTSTATGTLIGVVTGCPNQAPAGPTVVTGNELIPADVYNASTGRSGNPATVLLSLGSLNSLPINVQTATATAGSASLSAANTSGGLFLINATGITRADVTLPLSPIDGQQWWLSATTFITTVNVTSGSATNLMGTNSQPTTFTPSTTGITPRYIWRFNSANTTWYRIQ